MINTDTRRATYAKTQGLRRPARVSVSAAVFFALYGIPHPASAQQQASPTDVLQEVIVTATRREQSLESVPYSLSVISGDELTNTGVTDIASLTAQVPGLSVFDFGARTAGSSFPIIRGLNASPFSASGFRTVEQAPVGTYIGNSPIDGYFQLDDVQRVEVLRGPQGTLYGAGALGGALRIIPNSPELDKFEGDVEASGDTLAHSSGAGYTAAAMLNVPIGDTVAFRVSGKYAYEPGFIDVHGILERGGGPFGGIPVLADSADPVNSPGIFTGKNDWNDQNTFTGRASLLWKPVDEFNAELAFTYSNLNGDGGPVDNPLFPGGAYPLDPRITLPQGGNYQDFSAVNQPYSRTTSLASLDLSYDAGFATLASTSSYYRTTGSAVYDYTFNYLGLNSSVIPGFVGYYAGNPANPRYVQENIDTDSAHTFTQEVRLVSTSGPDKRFDYVLGAFYENQDRDGTNSTVDPGSPERSLAQGCTAPYFVGARFPNCLPGYAQGDVNFYQPDAQHFEDKSVFGELTWHFMSHGQITIGGRHFDQSFTDTQSYLLYSYGILVPSHEVSAPASKNTWKIDSSYEYASDQFVYALWSQGFRRGGANAFPSAGPFQTPSALTLYAPDSVDNYETGLKGRLPSGLSYTFDVFDDEWDEPQVGGSLPCGNVGVWNANKARSRGIEFDLKSPLFVPGLSITAAGTYANATFTENYLANGGACGNAFGTAGQQLPGSSKVSAATTINYDLNITSGYDLTVSLNDTYRSAMLLSTFPLVGQTQAPSVSGVNIANLSAWVNHRSWRLGVYVTNVADKLVILAPPAGGVASSANNYLAFDNTINQPREIGVRIGYTF